MDSFSDDYVQARSKFVESAHALNGKVDRIRHDASVGPSGEDLSVDVAWFGEKTASKVFVTLSGVHGVEGFYGSAAQVEWMRREENRRLPPDAAALLIHAINPYGFAWLRRTNEDNVDLNRNWINFDGCLPDNAPYEEIARDLCPSSWPPDKETQQRLSAWQVRNGMTAYLQAVTGGQWQHADGLFYGGVTPVWSRLTLSDILQSYLGSAARVVILDFHTGLGAHGYAEPIIHRKRDDPAFLRTRSWIGGAATSLYGGESISSEVHGDTMSAIPSLLPNAIVDAVSLECGVQPVDKVAFALRADNWLHVHDDPTGPKAVLIKKLIREAFHSDSPIWQGMALGQALVACRAAVWGLIQVVDSG
jgi:hypothetical protein